MPTNPENEIYTIHCIWVGIREKINFPGKGGCGIELGGSSVVEFRSLDTNRLKEVLRICLYAFLCDIHSTYVHVCPVFGSFSTIPLGLMLTNGWPADMRL